MRSLSILNKEVSRSEMTNERKWPCLGQNEWKEMGEGGGETYLGRGRGVWTLTSAHSSSFSSYFGFCARHPALKHIKISFTGDRNDLWCYKNQRKKENGKKSINFSRYLYQGLSLQYHNILLLVGLASYSVKNFSFFLLSWHERNVCGIQQLLNNLR